MPRTVSISAAASALVLAGCFFTGPINSKPDALIEKATSGPDYRGEFILFSAKSSRDDDGDRLVADWKAWTCANRNSCDEETPFAVLPDANLGDTFGLVIPAFRFIDDETSTLPTALISVELTLRDSQGAEDAVRLAVDVFNQEPDLDLQINGITSSVNQFHPIGIPVQVDARAQDPEGDPLTFTARLRAPGGDVRDLDAIANSGSQVTYEFVPDEVGSWQVEVAADDGLSEAPVSETATIAIQEDAPPWIAVTDPPFVAEDDEARFIVERANGVRRFAVLQVSDDLDIYPPPSADDPYRDRSRFRWFIRSPATGGERVEIADRDLPDYTLDATAFTPGDRLSLQVEVSDRVTRTQCAPAQTFCALQGPPFYQRVSWEVEIR